MKILKTSLAILSLSLFANCAQESLSVDVDQDAALTTQVSQDILSIPQINNIINESLKTTGDFDWGETSDIVLWSATYHGSGYLTIGYGNNGESFRTSESKRLTDTKDNILNTIQAVDGIGRDTFVIEDDAILNAVDVHVKSLEAIKELRKQDGIRYIEPNGYSFFTNTAYPQNRSSSGCGMDGSQQ